MECRNHHNNMADVTKVSDIALRGAKAPLFYKERK